MGNGENPWEKPPKMRKKSWEEHGKTYPTIRKTTGKPWEMGIPSTENHQKPWEEHGKTVGKAMKHAGKNSGKSIESVGNTRNHPEHMGKPLEKNGCHKANQFIKKKWWYDAMTAGTAK